MQLHLVCSDRHQDTWTAVSLALAWLGSPALVCSGRCRGSQEPGAVHGPYKQQSVGCGQAWSRRLWDLAFAGLRRSTGHSAGVPHCKCPDSRGAGCTFPLTKDARGSGPTLRSLCRWPSPAFRSGGRPQASRRQRVAANAQRRKPCHHGVPLPRWPHAALVCDRAPIGRHGN